MSWYAGRVPHSNSLLMKSIEYPQLSLTLSAAIGQFNCMQDYRTAFCINCGSNENVHDIMESVGPMAQQFVRLVIIDSHRPIHHSLHDEEDHSCVMLHDPDCGDSPLESIPKAAASLELGIGVSWADVQ